MVAGFHSFHWHGSELADAELDRALDELTSPTERDAYLRAFSSMLHSGNTVAAGIALDHFQYSGALTRFGGESALEQYEAEALAVARELLRLPPTPEDDVTFEGANHASALNAMMNLAQPQDAGLIADALALASDVNVRSAAYRAAGAALYTSAEPSPQLLAALASVAFDERLDMSERTEALTHIGDADSPEAVALLIRATEAAEVDLQTQGAFSLLSHGRLPAHRARLERLAATWPKDAGSRADEVRRAVNGFHSLYWTGARWDDAELGRAHQELRFPSGDADGYHRAFRTLLRSEHPMATGIALDHFASYEGVREVLDPDEAEAYGPEVLGLARETLRQPPSPPGLSPHHGAGANHLSALNTIGAHDAEASDAGPISDLLETAASEMVRHKALWVAYGAFKKAKSPDPRLLGIVHDLVSGPALSGHEELALHVLGDTLGPEANPFLIRALASDDVSVQVEAAWQLSHPRRIEGHRELLTGVAGSWPALTGRPRFLAAQVRKRALDGGSG